MIEGQDANAVVSFDWTTFNSPSTAVITAVAEEDDVDPVAIEPLYEVVDPDMLDNIVNRTIYPRGSPNARIEFTYRDYQVLVKANGRGYLYDQDDSLQSTAESGQSEVPKQAD